MQIRTEIRREQQAVVVKQPQKKVVTTSVTSSSSSSSGNLKSIFGISGQNTVRLDTPTFQYAYEH